MTARKLSQIRNTHHNISKMHKRQLHIAKNINNKLDKNAIIAQADKGKTVVIIHEQEYHEKARTFLSENNFEPTPLDPTNKYQAHITKMLKQRNLIFHKHQHARLIKKNPTPPTMKAQLKLHKPGIPIRPVVNNRTAPTYKATKKLNNILNQHLHLENLYTVKNFTKLANNLTKITLKDSYRLITLDTKDLYVNILIHEALQTTRTQLYKHNNKTFTDQICILLEAMLNQKYFTYQTHIYWPTKVVAMGSPISGLITEILL